MLSVTGNRKLTTGLSYLFIPMMNCLKKPKEQFKQAIQSYFIQPEVIGDYLKAAGGRFFPVNEKSWADPFWTDPADPHIFTAAQPLINRQTRLSYTALNPAYSLILKEGIWGQALNSIIVDQVSPEQAADNAIA